MRNEIINNWRPEISALLKRFTDAGFTLVSADNGEDKLNFDGDLDKFIECLDACDEAQLRVSKGDKQTWLYLVLGNSPGEIVCDYGVKVGGSQEDRLAVAAFNAAVDKVTDAHYAEWSDRKQPTKARR